MQNNKSENLIVQLSFDFALRTIAYCEALDIQKKYVVSRQLLRSGTSIGANVREAQNAESKADFIHKMKIAAKEADETEYCLMLCQNSKGYLNCEDLIALCQSLTKVLSKIIASSKRISSG